MTKNISYIKKLYGKNWILQYSWNYVKISYDISMFTKNILFAPFCGNLLYKALAYLVVACLCCAGVPVRHICMKSWTRGTRFVYPYHYHRLQSTSRRAGKCPALEVGIINHYCVLNCSHNVNPLRIILLIIY